MAASLALAACSFAPARTGSKGTMPPPGPNGELDPSAMPDFIAVAGDTGPVGWVEKAAVTDPADKTWPVYADDLTTLVGRLVPGKGFVPVGVDPETAPKIPVEVGAASPAALVTPGSVLVMVRNRSAQIVWIGVSSTAPEWMGSAGFDPGSMGTACFAGAADDRVVVLDRSPTDGGALERQAIYQGEPNRAQPVSRWVDILPTGLAQSGDGAPPWWQGDAWC